MPEPLPVIKTPWGSAAPPSGAGPGAGREDLPRVLVPDHTLIRRVGKGSYGEVWLAHNFLGVHRAVKIIDRRTFDDDRPFEREFAGIQRFEPVSRTHESQLNILHVGRGPDCFYYVMELADDVGHGRAIDEGSYTPRTLRSELLLRGRLPVDECIRLGLALTTALGHLHRHGLVHRDIKPSNIVFVGGIPKLADIGLVARTEATMSFVGTEGYLPPEGPGTVQADVFGLGKVLYELSTGHDRQQFPELPTRITELPDRAALAELNEVLLRACAPDVRQRYASAADMHADLALLQSGKSVARMRTVERRLKLVARATVAVAVLAMVAGLAFFYQQIQTREARRLAAQNRALAEEKTQLADDKSKLAEENRERLVRLGIANGVRLLEADDYSGALLWFADALPLLTNNPAAEAIHRIRIQQVLSQSPRLLQVMPHDASVAAGAFSPDGRRVATGTSKGELHILDAEAGAAVLGPLPFGKRIEDLRFTKEGTRLMARSCSDQGTAFHRRDADGFAVVLNAATGEPAFSAVTKAVRSAFSPDDRWLAVARTNFVIEVLDATDGRRVVELSGHTNQITMLSFSPDGSLLASASQDRTVRLWRLPSGEPVGRPLRHEQSVIRAVFSPDARRLATATEAPFGEKWCFIHTWDVATGTEIGSATKAASPVFALDFDPANRRRLITGDDNYWINVRDSDSHLAVLPPLKFEGSVARCWAFSPDGLRFAAGSDDGTAWVWDLETGLPLTPSLRHVGWVESVRFSPDGRRLLTTSDDGTARIWDLGALPEAAKPLQLDANITGFPHREMAALHALSRDGRRLLLNMSDRTLRLLDLETLSQEGTPMPAPDGEAAFAITFDASGYQWAAARGIMDGGPHPSNVSLWREQGREVRHLELQHPEAARFLQFKADGSRLFTWSRDARVRTWQTADGKLLDEQEIPDLYWWMLALSTDGRRAVMARTGDVLPELLDLSTPGAPGVPLAGAGQTSMAAFSPEGDRVASVGTDQHGHIWDARTGQALTLPFKHGGVLFWIEWSPDGRRVLTAGLAGTVKVWDAATGELAAVPMKLGQTPVRLAHFSPDGRFVVARSDDRFVKVWDSATAEPVTPALNHAGKVPTLMIAPDNRLVTVSAPAVIRAWDLAPTRLPAGVITDYARLLAGRTLDRAGDLRPLKPSELAALSQTLRTSQPALFTTETKDLREWHHRHVSPLTTLARIRAASFHLDRLAKLDPKDAGVGEQRAKVETGRIPPRDPATPPNLVDLSDHYTHSFGVLPWQNFAALPLGLQTLAGTRFDLRGLVRLEAADSEDLVALGSFRLPEARDIRVDQRCRALHFLQAVAGDRGKDGDEVARWVIHYADGSVREWPVIYGEQLRDSWWWSARSPKEADKAVIAWEGHPPQVTKRGVESVRLFKATWTNPLPEVEVTRLDFVIGKVRVRPFVVAITAE